MESIMQKWDSYPKVRQGDRVIWSPEPNYPEHLWHLGEVLVANNQSCDVRVFIGNGVTADKHDCWHADDPNCKTMPQAYREPARGVFKLAASEIEARNDRQQLEILRRQFAQLRQEVQAARREMQERVDKALGQFDESSPIGRRKPQSAGV